MLLGCASLFSRVRRFVACVRNCFGCVKPTPIIAVDEPSKGLRIQGRSIKQRSLSEDFWSTSPHEMENSAMQSQRDQHGAGSSSNPNDFVNQGLLLWNQTRQQWVGNRRLNAQHQKPREPKISWNATYESLLGSTKAFAQPIPLGVQSHANLHAIFPFRMLLVENIRMHHVENNVVFICVFGKCVFGFLLAGNGKFPRGRLGAGRPI